MSVLATHLVLAVLPLVVVVLLARARPQRLGADAPFDVRWDLGIAALGGLVFAGLSTFYLADLFLQGGPVTGADFHDYCACVGASRGDHDGGWRATRSFASGVLPSLLARRFGVVDGLLIGAMISQWVMGTGIVLWGRALHSRLAGLAAVILACGVAPLVTLGRTVTFYPEIIAVFVLAAALSVLALRTASRWAVLAAGIAIGLSLLMDVRAIVWAPPMLAVVGVAVIRMQTWPHRLGAALLVLLPLLVSAQVSEFVYLRGIPSLERQMDAHVDDVLTIVGAPPEDLAGERPDRGAIWGQTPVLGIPASLVRLVQGRARVPSTARTLPETVAGRSQQILPWLPVWCVGLCIGAWGLRRRWWLLIGLGVPLVPFVSATHSAGWFLYRPRFLASGMVIVPVVIGVGLAVAILGSLSRADLKTPVRPSWRVPVVSGCLVVLVLGWVPSWFSPFADWRYPLAVDANPRNALQSAVLDKQIGPRVSPMCTVTIQADLTAGHLAGSRILRWEPASQK